MNKTRKTSSIQNTKIFSNGKAQSGAIARTLTVWSTIELDVYSLVKYMHNKFSKNFATRKKQLNKKYVEKRNTITPSAQALKQKKTHSTH